MKRQELVRELQRACRQVLAAEDNDDLVMAAGQVAARYADLLVKRSHEERSVATAWGDAGRPIPRDAEGNVLTEEPAYSTSAGPLPAPEVDPKRHAHFWGSLVAERDDS